MIKVIVLDFSGPGMNKRQHPFFPQTMMHDHSMHILKYLHSQAMKSCPIKIIQNMTDFRSSENYLAL
jgi:hypothetical protein